LADACLISVVRLEEHPRGKAVGVSLIPWHPTGDRLAPTTQGGHMEAIKDRVCRLNAAVIEEEETP
jgi:hypothetical protein